MTQTDVINEFRAVMRRVDKAKPDKADIDAVDTFLREYPQFWVIAGDLAEQANGNMIEKLEAPRSMKESLKVGMSRMTAELAQPGDGELERLVIRQIVGCWLRLSYIEYVYSQYLITGTQTLNNGDFWERRANSAQHRYIRAIESLARVRRMRLPAVQVNIAEQQVNQVNARG